MFMGLAKGPYHKTELEVGIRYGATLVENAFHSFRSPRSILADTICLRVNDPAKDVASTHRQLTRYDELNSAFDRLTFGVAGINERHESPCTLNN
jgi:hypothetical protein